MEKNKNHAKSKIGVVVVGIVVAVYAIFYATICFFIYKDVANPFVLLYGLIPLAVLIGVILAARMRMKEINKGELDEAKKY